MYYTFCKLLFAVSRDLLTLKNTTEGTFKSDGKEKMNKKTNVKFITESALIAALYAVLTYIAAVMNLAFGGVQFRFSEALCVLPIFTPAAIPGLTMGCLISNLASPLGIVDWIFGPIATLLATLVTRKMREVKLFDIPFISLLSPVIFNALIIGFEIAAITENGFNLSAVSFAAFSYQFLSVGLGELLVLFVLGLPLIFLLRKVKIFKR